MQYNALLTEALYRQKDVLMAYITPSTLSLKTCFQSKYSLPYFQRDYKWESRHFLEMLNDIQNAFLLSYESTHGRRDVSSYPPYFLGSIITAVETNGKRPLIDGQQRITSIFILLVFLKDISRITTFQTLWL